MARKRSRNDGTDISSALARQWEYMRGEPKPDWEDGPISDGVHFKAKHKPCGTEVLIRAGNERVCPKCQPEEGAKEKRTK